MIVILYLGQVTLLLLNRNPVPWDIILWVMNLDTILAAIMTGKNKQYGKMFKYLFFVFLEKLQVVHLMIMDMGLSLNLPTGKFK